MSGMTVSVFGGGTVASTADLEQAFSDHPSLLARILAATAVDQTGLLGSLFAEIAVYINQRSSNGAAAAPTQTNGASKKRKLDDGQAASQPANGSASSSAAGIQDRAITYTSDGVSVSVPARKKLKLEFSADTRDARRGEIQLLNPADGAVEYVLPSAAADQAFCLPVPEKQARQWNFVVFPRPGATDAATGAPLEQLVFTVNEPKAGADVVDDVKATEAALNALLEPLGRGGVTRPDEREFVSSIAQPHRKGEPAFHVKAHRGSKDGYLFWLATGIVFGFRKPLAYFPFAAIESISYTSVLQRTFNVVIATTAMEGVPAQEVEFSMLDQADFAGIDAYVKRHGLHDASMAAARQAKAYNVNKDNTKVLTEEDFKDGEEPGEPGQEQTGKTEQELQDEEDELEEDYEASGGESDGEGEDSEEEEEGEEGEGYEEGEEYDEEEGYDETEEAS